MEAAPVARRSARRVYSAFTFGFLPTVAAASRRSGGAGFNPGGGPPTGRLHERTRYGCSFGRRGTQRKHCRCKACR
jgi:hypothetical protein